jgi:hypothetical protein
MGKREQLQGLFEKISDAYEDLVEQKDITDDYVDLQFLRHGVEVGRVRLFLENNVVINNQDECMQLVRIVDHYGGEEVHVSPVVSAVIAVCTK